MEILIMEDEPINAERLVKLLKNINHNCNVQPVVPSVQAAKSALEAKRPDLIIADICLSDGLSFEALEDYKEDVPVIFTTAYDEYAIRAFDFNSIAYLLKPIKEVELEKAISKLDHMQYNASKEMSHLMKAICDRTIHWRERLLLYNGTSISPIRVQDVCYFESDMRFTKVILKDGRHGLTEMSLDTLESQLSPSSFMRVSRQHIVNVDEVVRLERADTKHYSIVLSSSDKRIIATNQRCKSLLELLDN